ncbi:type II toxin-antitoxin system ParD family antitoxin [Verminephrobacter aporrectodeae subsp. tuberculatae]|nr:type II toxin-antitoxin system ParD family antitoxin [Verminephrobacter aporrectodeae subsp. tuberculatae]
MHPLPHPPPKTPTMNVSLTHALREIVDQRLRSGLYGNASEYVRELIRRDDEATGQLRALYQAGVDSGAAAPMAAADWDALRAAARSRPTRSA